MTDEAIQSHYGLDSIMATVKKCDKEIEYKLADVPVAEKLEKFMEDVKFGIHPITAFALAQPPPPKARPVSPGEGHADAEKQDQPDPEDETEVRRIVQVLCSLGFTAEEGVFNCIIIARLEDAINRQLTARITIDDEPDGLVDELIEHKFICPLDRAFLIGALADVFRKLAVRSAKRLREECEELGKGADEMVNGNGVDNVDNNRRKRTLEDVDKVKKESLFAKLKHYCYTDSDDIDTRKMDPKIAADLRDPTHVTKRFPLPEGAFFEPPAAPDGSEPFRIPPPGTNAFDCSHLEAQALAKKLPVTSAAAEVAYTPKEPNTVYDPYSNLQGAQKVLEGLTVTSDDVEEKQREE